MTPQDRFKKKKPFEPKPMEPLSPLPKSTYSEMPYMPDKDLNASSDMSKPYYGLEYDPKSSKSPFRKVRVGGK